jgi:hypothetical protein
VDKKELLERLEETIYTIDSGNYGDAIRELDLLIELLK